MDDLINLADLVLDLETYPDTITLQRLLPKLGNNYALIWTICKCQADDHSIASDSVVYLLDCGPHVHHMYSYLQWLSNMMAQTYFCLVKNFAPAITEALTYCEDRVVA